MAELRVALVYTVTGPELTGAVEGAVRAVLGKVELVSYSDPSILAEAVAAGRVTRPGAVRLVRSYLRAVEDGADAILNCCSTVGEVAASAQGLMDCLGVPLVRIDEAMCAAAVRQAARVVVLATTATTLAPTGNTLQRAAREQGRAIEVVPGLVDTTGMGHEAYRAALLARARELEPRADAFVLAQGSMAFCEGYLQERLDVPVLSSPRYGAADLARRLGR